MITIVLNVVKIEINLFSFVTLVGSKVSSSDYFFQIFFEVAF